MEDRSLSEIETLTQESGFIHALSYLIFRDFYQPRVEFGLLENFLPAKEKLIGSEVLLLSGLMVKKPINLSTPTSSVMKQYIDKAESLLQDLHHDLNEPLWESFNNAINDPGTDLPFFEGAALREPMFYAGESAYDFQYLEFAEEKYKNDESWLLENKGITVNQMHVSCGYRLAIIISAAASSGASSQ